MPSANELQGLESTPYSLSVSLSTVLSLSPQPLDVDCRPEDSDASPGATPLPAIAQSSPSAQISLGSMDQSGRQSSTGLPSEIPGEVDNSTASNNSIADVDPQIVEALKSKDRIYVLKLGEQMESLINDHRIRIDLTPATSYQRLLVHRCSAYYKLSPETDPISKTISVVATVESKIPVRRICELVPVELPAQPTFKIMRRIPLDRTRSKPQSQTGSVAGEDTELSDVEPSESGSLGGRSNTTGSSKKHMTIEEREAAYNEARSRIFMDFQGSDKDKDKGLSASSSSLSLVSGAASTGAGGEGSSVGEPDDSLSSPATESEWSGPVARDKKENRRNGSGHSSGTPSRGLRSNAPAFNGPGSSRASRAPSPSFKYPSLYDTSAPSPYEASLLSAQHHGGYINSYLYTYPQPPPPQGQNYLASYPYFHPYTYPLPHQNPLHSSDSSSPANGDIYTQSHQNPFPGAPYDPYYWNPPPATQQAPQALPSTQHSQSSQSHQNSQSLPAPLHTQYSPYVPPVPPYSPYPMASYYSQPHPPLQQMQSSPTPMPNHGLYQPDTRSASGAGNGFESGNITDNIISNRTYPGNNNGSDFTNANYKHRNAPTARAAWSYGPGVGMGGFGVANNSTINGMGNNGEAIGPRLSSTARRTSGTSSLGSGGNGHRTPAGDEASSTASSSTSSTSSRQTYTSTSSQHPLPPRPDWAVGLKPQPTLHPPHSRHHDHSLNNSRTMSPARNGGQHQNVNVNTRSAQSIPSVSLQPNANDFPPLTSISPSTEKRTPPVTGVWNGTSTRSILMPGNIGSQQATVPVQHNSPYSNAANGSSNSRLEDTDRTYERPPPKNAELYNPNKKAWKPTGNIIPRGSQTIPDRSDSERPEDERVSSDSVDNVLAETVGSVSIQDKDPVAKSGPAVALTT